MSVNSEMSVAFRRVMHIPTLLYPINVSVAIKGTHNRFRVYCDACRNLLSKRVCEIFTLPLFSSTQTGVLRSGTLRGNLLCMKLFSASCQICLGNFNGIGILEIVHITKLI